MSEVRLAAEPRTEFGKGGARRTRKAGRIPAVIYGHGASPRHVSLPAHDFAMAVRRNGANVLLTLSIDGEEQLAIPKAIQRHPVKNEYEHIDLLAVRRGEKVTVDVALTVVGDLVPSALLAQDASTITVETDATSIPSQFDIDIADKPIGTQITAADLELPAGVTLVSDPETLLVAINEAPTAEELEADIAESVDELGIVEDAPEQEPAADGEKSGSDEG